MKKNFILFNVGVKMKPENRNKLFLKALRKHGFIPNFGLATSAMIPKQESIKILYEHGIIRFMELPSNCNTLYLFVGDDSIDAFSEYMAWFDMNYKDREAIVIEDPKLFKEYDLRSYTKGIPDYFVGERFICLKNTISSPMHFIRDDGSIINVLILRDGYIRVDLINVKCKTISFRHSPLLADTIDILVDSDYRQGDIYIKDVKSGVSFRNTSLASELKNQAVLRPIDTNNGIYFAECRFHYYPEIAPHLFIDIMRELDISNFEYNLSLFQNN